MAGPDVNPMDFLDRASTLVGTESLSRQGVRELRILSESRFLSLIREFVEESLAEVIDARQSIRGEGAIGEDGASGEPADGRLSREYQRRWEALKTKHEVGLRQVERRIDRLARLLRDLDRSVVEISDLDARKPAGRDEAAPTEAPEPVDRSVLLREMLLDDDAKD